jgi:gamma-glutamyl hercynylcysteine S-oxide synthase
VTEPADAARSARRPALEDPEAIRHAGPELLSLALLDTRNQLLARLAQDESPPALRQALKAGAYQEHWIGCHPQRGRGEACDAHGVRLAGIEPALAEWLSPQGGPPAPDAVRAYLSQTLEVTLDLLAGTPDDDQALHFYRQSLCHEDRLCEQFDEDHRAGQPPARVQRDALWLPSQRWQLGSPAGGYVPVLERWAHEVVLPEFEIDAQAVNWAQFVEFAEDGGYDRAELWTDAGWAWVQAEARRAPAGVEQLRGGVVLQRGLGARAGLQRAAASQPVLHVSRHEAQAWCRWAGRRLPTEPEWELAASTAASRGFVWGDVFEWVAGTARLWPGAPAPAPGAIDHAPTGSQAPAGVLRGASFATRARWRHSRARRFVMPNADNMFVGFRSCAL